MRTSPPQKMGTCGTRALSDTDVSPAAKRLSRAQTRRAGSASAHAHLQSVPSASALRQDANAPRAQTGGPIQP